MAEKLKALILRAKTNKFTVYAVAFIVYVAFVVYYMYPQATNCSDTVYGFGDSTAGPIWKFGINDSNPLWGAENVTNFPKGESLYNPALFSASGQFTLFWIFAKFAGPICGYNILNMAGFLLTSVAMFSFVLWITRKFYVSLLAGFIVSFTPYLQTKVGVHPSYGYMGIILIIIWLCILVLLRSKLSYKILLGILLAIATYFDPYFILFSVVAVASVLIGYVLIKKDFKKTIIHIFKSIRLVILIFSILIIPLAFVYVTQKSAIDSFTSGSRGTHAEIVQTAISCSNYPFEYIIPNENNYILNALSNGEYRTGVIKAADIIKKKCGGAEDGVYLSIVIVLTVLIFFIILVWELINHRRPKFGKNKDYYFVIIISLTLIFIAGILALPALKIFGHIPTPSRILIDLTTIWRIVSRLYLLVLIGFTILFSISLNYFSVYIKNKKILALIFITMFLIIFTEYQTTRPFAGSPFSNFSYSRDTPSVYKDMANDDSFKVLVEYPLTKLGEMDASVYYMTMQTTDHKVRLNSINPNSELEPLRQSIKDLSDPQTVSVLKALGVERIIIHGLTIEESVNIKGLKLLHFYDNVNFNLSVISPMIKNRTIALLKISDQIEPAEYYIQLGKTFVTNLDLQRSPVDIEYESINDAELSIQSIPGVDITSREFSYCFDIKSMGLNRQNTITVKDEKGKVIYENSIDNGYLPISLKSESRVLYVSNKEGNNLRFSNLGCTN